MSYSLNELLVVQHVVSSCRENENRRSIPGTVQQEGIYACFKWTGPHSAHCAYESHELDVTSGTPSGLFLTPHVRKAAKHRSIPKRPGLITSFPEHRRLTGGHVSTVLRS